MLHSFLFKLFRNFLFFPRLGKKVDQTITGSRITVECFISSLHWEAKQFQYFRLLNKRLYVVHVKNHLISLHSPLSLKARRWIYWLANFVFLLRVWGSLSLLSLLGVYEVSLPNSVGQLRILFLKTLFKESIPCSLSCVITWMRGSILPIWSIHYSKHCSDSQW